jgi:hypothetical protein
MHSIQSRRRFHVTSVYGGWRCERAQHRDPRTSSRLAQIASVLSVSPGYFFGDITAVERMNDEAVAEMEWIARLMEPGAIALLRAYSAMSVSKRAALRNLAEAMVPEQAVQ